MKIHHLNCGTMRPPATPGGLVCHVLLVETDNGLVLVDSGFGSRDGEAPGRRFGPARHLIRPAFDPDESAVRQLAGLGFAAEDVRDVVLTHFDADHTGGLADFPAAQVHLTAAEAFGALHPQTRIERGRYPAAQRDHGPILVEHTPRESWRGFPAAEEIAPGIVLISLPGHTRGHAAVAVDAGDHWVLHAGDAFYHHGQLAGTRVPRTLTAMERLIAHNWRQVQGNHERLTELWRAADPDLLLVNAHDPALLAAARKRD